MSSSGKADITLDLFAGTKPRVTVKFEDLEETIVPVPAIDFAGLTKVAIVWEGAVNLDLHAYEYAAKHGSDGHVWQGSSRKAGDAHILVDITKRARGFLFQSDDAARDGAKVEVFTLIHRKDQKYGAISLALDYESRGAVLEPPYCGDGVLASVRYKIFRMDGATPRPPENGIVPAAPCGIKLEQKARFNTTSVGDIRIRR